MRSSDSVLNSTRRCPAVILDPDQRGALPSSRRGRRRLGDGILNSTKRHSTRILDPDRRKPLPSSRRRRLRPGARARLRRGHDHRGDGRGHLRRAAERPVPRELGHGPLDLFGKALLQAAASGDWRYSDWRYSDWRYSDSVLNSARRRPAVILDPDQRDALPSSRRGRLRPGAGSGFKRGHDHRRPAAARKPAEHLSERQPERLGDDWDQRRGQPQRQLRDELGG